MGTREIRIYVRKENVYKGKIANFRSTTYGHGCEGCCFYIKESDFYNHTPAPCENYKRKDHRNVKFVKIK